MMAGWRRVRACLHRVGRRGAWEHALDEELRACLDEEIAARIGAGMAPGEARRTALADFGGLEPVKAQVRAAAAGASIERLVQDLRHAWRALSRSRGYTAWIVGSLAVGMAVMTAALALLNALLVRPLPGVGDQERLVRIAISRNCGRPDCWTPMSSLTDYDRLRERLGGVEDLAAHAYGELAVGLPDARAMRGLFTSANYFGVLGTEAVVGRVFGRADEPHQTPVAVLAHRVWVSEFGSDPSVVGRSVRVADQAVEIVGVAPPFFGGTDLRIRSQPPDIWLPLWLADRTSSRTAAEQRRSERHLFFTGRLGPGVGPGQLQAEADVAAAALAAVRDPGSPHGRAEILPVTITRPGNRHLTILLVLPIPMLVLVIACVNAANLLLARGSQRGREIAIRLALGASRGRVIRQLLIESGMLALAATAIAVPLAAWSLDLAGQPLRSVPMPVDATVVLLAVATATCTSLAFGVVPALRTTAQQPSRVLGPAAGASASPGQSLARRALLVAQVALAIGLLATGWQLVATVRFQGGGAGIPGDRLLIARFDLEPLRLEPAASERFYHRLRETLVRVPGVESAGLARHTAVWTFGRGAGPSSLTVWHPGDAPASEGRVYIGGYASAGLFDAVGLRLLGGRLFSDAERRGRPRAAIVNQRFADEFGGPVVGQILRVAPRQQGLAAALDVEIVGVIESAREPRYTEDGRPVPKLYLPSPVEPEPALALYVRSRTAAAALGPAVHDTVRQIDPRVPVLEIGSLDELNERSMAPQLWLARAAALLGAIGLLLATAGLYGVASFVVSMRSREIAIRMAIGARPRRVLGKVLGQSMRLAATGLLIGGLAAYVASRIIQAEHHGVHGMDVTAFGGSAALFAAAMLLAGGIPAIRASRLDPVVGLRDG